MTDERNSREWLEEIWSDQRLIREDQRRLADAYNQLKDVMTAQLQQIKDLAAKIKTDCDTIAALRAKIVELEAQIAQGDTPADFQPIIDELKQIDDLILAGTGVVTGIQIEPGTPTEHPA
jgi:SMC interacting uncharacterized protein involved in chromosome segregation